MNNHKSNRFFETSVSFVLILCLIFSSLSVYLSDGFLNEANQEDEVLLSYFSNYHLTKTSETHILAELMDKEEEEDSIKHKKIKTLLFAKILRVIWSYLPLEIETTKYSEHSENPILIVKEPHYIEFCSLKIPS